jgi:hypothetical protein
LRPVHAAARNKKLNAATQSIRARIGTQKAEGRFDRGTRVTFRGACSQPNLILRRSRRRPCRRTLKAVICVINDGSKPRAPAGRLFTFLILEGCRRNVPSDARTILFGTNKIIIGSTKIIIGSIELKGRISNMPTPTVAAPAAAPAKRAVHQPRQLPPPNSDFYELYETLNSDELATVKRVRAFMEAKLRLLLRNTGWKTPFPSNCCRL